MQDTHCKDDLTLSFQVSQMEFITNQKGGKWQQIHHQEQTAHFIGGALSDHALAATQGDSELLNALIVIIIIILLDPIELRVKKIRSRLRANKLSCAIYIYIYALQEQDVAS